MAVENNTTWEAAMAEDLDDGKEEARRPKRPESDPTKKPFTPETLDRTVVATPLQDRIDQQGEDKVQAIIIDINLDYPGRREAARQRIYEEIDALIGPPRDRPPEVDDDDWERIDIAKSDYSQQYVFGRLSGRHIRELAQRDRSAEQQAIYRIWLDFVLEKFTNKSISTVKADAARNAFGALGRDIVFAVLDTGIDGAHPHFAKHKNLDLPDPLLHRDLTAGGSLSDDELAKRALTDPAGHGTHVAGIIAGESQGAVSAEVRERDERGNVQRKTISIDRISGMAPQCKLLSLKILRDDGKGHSSNLIAALEYIQAINGHGRRLRIHGVNMSVGYPFEPEWFACGQSPLCVEVDRLVRTGVVVVVAAGNSGYGTHQTLSGAVSAGLDLTINDPGNAELAITVGATHRDAPHTYGVSYFSSKGPTGDGRIKPDLVAPGEKIVSCASHSGNGPHPGGYKEDSGTSMAAPHVAGVIAAFLSVRREFIGRAEAVKAIFMSNATDLKRSVEFQGKGLVDLMRAMQSV
jgi:subtilisin family serine protease